MKGNQGGHKALKMVSNSPLKRKGVHSLTLPGSDHGATPKICGFAGMTQIWELHYSVPGVMPSAVVALAGTMVLGRLLCVLDGDDEPKQTETHSFEMMPQITKELAAVL